MNTRTKTNMLDGYAMLMPSSNCDKPSNLYSDVERRVFFKTCRSGELIIIPVIMSELYSVPCDYNNILVRRRNGHRTATEHLNKYITYPTSFVFESYMIMEDAIDSKESLRTALNMYLNTHYVGYYKIHWRHMTFLIGKGFIADYDNNLPLVITVHPYEHKSTIRYKPRFVLSPQIFSDKKYTGLKNIFVKDVIEGVGIRRFNSNYDVMISDTSNFVIINDTKEEYSNEYLNKLLMKKIKILKDSLLYN